MSVSPYLPGLLSRMGPSLYSPAMMFASEPTRYFSTNTLLDAFQTQPETGAIFMPLVHQGSNSVEMSLHGLDRESSRAARHTLETLIREGLPFVDREEASVARNQPLPATAGEWHVGDRVGEGGETALSFFHPRSRRFIRLQLFEDGGFSVASGWQSSQVRLSQEVSMNGSGRLVPGGYQIEFDGAPVESIKAFLKMPQASGAELALTLAARIYASGQYTPEESGCSLMTMGAKGRWRNLPKDGRSWVLPEGIETMNPVMIGTRRHLTRREGARVRQPVADAYWEAREGRYGHLMVRLHNLPDQRLPLNPELKSLLWDGALGLLYGEGRD